MAVLFGSVRITMELLTSTVCYSQVSSERITSATLIDYFNQTVNMSAFTMITSVLMHISFLFKYSYIKTLHIIAI